MSTDIKTTTFVPTTIEEKLQIAMRLKTEGNDAVQAREYTKAIGKYTKIFAYINGLKSAPVMEGMEQMIAQAGSSSIESKSNSVTTEQIAAIDQLTNAANSNLALCYLNTKQPGKALEYCNKVLALQPDNGKMLFRRGWAQFDLKDIDLAHEDLKRALELQPNDAGIKTKLLEVRKRISASEDALRRNLFNAFNKVDVSTNKDKPIKRDPSTGKILDDTSKIELIN